MSKTIRHIKNPITLGNAISFDIKGWSPSYILPGNRALPYDIPWQERTPEELFSFWNKDGWYNLKYSPEKKWDRFWLPLTDDTSYEDGLALYNKWVQECKKDGDQLIVVFVDLGVVGGDGPLTVKYGKALTWYGYVLLGAFKGKDLNFIEEGIDNEMLWAKIAHRFISDPKSKYMSMDEMNNFIWELRKMSSDHL